MTLSLFDLNKFISNLFLYEKNPKIAVAVSGGPDSIALVFILKKWIKIKKGKLIALIVDHKIREESHNETLITKKFLKEKNIDSCILKISQNKVLKGQMSVARTNRYEKMLNYCKKNKIFHLFLAHHFDDNIETFLLRKIGGSNFEGLNCMKNISINGNIQVIRPLLSFRKKQILDYNKKNRLFFIEDPSNKNFKYSRSIVRQYIENDLKIKKNVIKDFNMIVDNYENYTKMIFYIINILIIKISSKNVFINKDIFLNLDSELKIKVIDILFKFLKNKNFKIRYKQIENIINILNQSMSKPFISNNVIISKYNKSLSFSVN